MREFYRAHQPYDLIKPKKAEDLEQVATAAGFDVRSVYGSRCLLGFRVRPRTAFQCTRLDSPPHWDASIGADASTAVQIRSDGDFRSIYLGDAIRLWKSPRRRRTQSKVQKLVIESHVIARMIVHVAAYQGVLDTKARKALGMWIVRVGPGVGRLVEMSGSDQLSSIMKKSFREDSPTLLLLLLLLYCGADGGRTEMFNGRGTFG
ncbi:hypothetical protein B296_00028739 [Ensete ventricosum]|uniref:Uncharacterized protein n=1 Tax=Ensete ventricosum TaxID=4639 RepID=A0A426ZRJ0_ENSVE|nr:hypothetical protein B296_00028739 [Ensete ventricosum]